jgi:hypothetical protein
VKLYRIVTYLSVLLILTDRENKVQGLRQKVGSYFKDELQKRETVASKVSRNTATSLQRGRFIAVLQRRSPQQARLLPTAQGRFDDRRCR